MARSNKGAAGAAIKELDIIGGQPSTPPESTLPEPPGGSPVIGPEGPGGVEDGHVAADLRELDEALGGGGEGGGEGSHSDDDADDAQRESPTPHRPLVSVPARPARRARRKGPETKLRVELELPEDVMNRAKASVRPRFTGMERSQGQKFAFAAYVLAVDDLVGGAGAFDLHGIETVEDMAERVKIALAETLAVSPQSSTAA